MAINSPHSLYPVTQRAHRLLIDWPHLSALISQSPNFYLINNSLRVGLICLFYVNIIFILLILQLEIFQLQIFRVFQTMQTLRVSEISRSFKQRFGLNKQYIVWPFGSIIICIEYHFNWTIKNCQASGLWFLRIH